MADSKPGAEYYRERARQLQIQADSASSDELRASYQELATNWLQLAEAMERAVLRADQPKFPD